MENIYQNQNTFNIQYGVVLEETASFLTQGPGGLCQESTHRPRYMK